MTKILSIIFIATLLISCSNGAQDSESESDNGNSVQTNKSGKTEDEIEQKIANTDLQVDLKEENSLYFAKDDGSSIEVKALLDKTNGIVKMEEKYVDKSKNEYGTRVFYIENAKKYASKERFEEKSGGKVYFVERISYYDNQEKVTATKIRKAPFEEELDAQVFEKVDLFDCSIKQALDVLNQEGEFETRFQGFINSAKDSYISVGKSEDGYVSALLVQYENTTTQKLRKNQTSSIGEKLDLEYQKIIDENGFEFQVLLTVTEAK